MKKALVTGITGQDGAYLADLLLSKNYEVYGAIRRTTLPNLTGLEFLKISNHPNLKLVPYDITDLSTNIRILNDIEPDEIYNLAAQSFVKLSFDQPILTSEITGMGPLCILEAIRIVNKKIKFYQASTSEMPSCLHIG